MPDTLTELGVLGAGAAVAVAVLKSLTPLLKGKSNGHAPTCMMSGTLADQLSRHCVRAEDFIDHDRGSDQAECLAAINMKLDQQGKQMERLISLGEQFVMLTETHKRGGGGR